MKKILAVVLALAVYGCVRGYAITVAQECYDQKAASIREKDLPKQKTTGRSFAVMKEDGAKIGVIKFDAKNRVTFTPAREADIEADIQKFQAVVEGINANRYIEVVFNEPLDAACFSSPYVPEWGLMQDIIFKVGVDDLRFLSALEYYLKGDSILLKK